MADVLVPLARWARWLANFEQSHGPATCTTRDGALQGSAPDGATFTVRLPFSRPYADRPDPDALALAATPPPAWGVLLVRKGGFAVARLSGTTVADSKVGRRHVQGRTKAGGQSQQRFARRRGNQAREAYEAAADHAARILEGVPAVVTGGDRAAVREVLARPGLAELDVVGPWLAVADPRRGVLEGAVADAQALQVEVRNTPSG